MVTDNKESGVFFKIDDNSRFFHSDFLDSLGGLKKPYHQDQSGSSSSSPFRLRIDNKGIIILIGSDPLPNFFLDNSTGMLCYSDEVEGSPSTDNIYLSSDGNVVLNDGGD